MAEATRPYAFENSFLVLRDSTGEIVARFTKRDAIGIAYDAIDGTLIKHGASPRIKDYVDMYRAKLSSHPAGSALLKGFTELRIPVTVLESERALDELNSAVEITGRVVNLSDRLNQAIAADQLTSR